MELATVWGAAGVLVGFQVAAMTLRINREIAVSDRSGEELTWLPPADMVNMLSIGVTMLGVFLAPILEPVSDKTAGRLFGLSVLLLAGYPFALAGHYDMLNKRSARSFVYFPFQEKVCVAAIALAAGVYVVFIILA